MASIAGLAAARNMAFYCASKFALVAISRTLQQELTGTGVYCSVICPGVAQTGFQQNAPNEKYPRAAALSTCTSAQVADAVVASMYQRRMGEIIIPWHSTLLMRFGAAFPGVARAIMNLIG
ncbi:MAG: SDR family NAD(P)-dependent oxidoreductase, partial [Roseiflexaceae bacterium]